MIKPWLYAILSLLLFLIGVYLVLMYALPLVLPFAVALLLAEIIDPLVERMTWRGRVPRSVAVGVILLLLAGLMITAVTAAIARLVLEIQTLIPQLPYLQAVGMDIGRSFAEQFGAFNASLPASIQAMMAKNLVALEEALSKGLPSLAGTLSAFSGLPAFITNLLIAMIATFFISRDRREIFDFLLSLFPTELRPKVRQVKGEVWTSAMGFAKAQMFLIGLTMVQSVIGLALIGSEYAVLMGLVIGFFDVLPLLGPATVYLPWIAYSLLFGSKVFGMKLLVLWAVVAGVRQVLEPKMVGDQIGLHPLAILLSVYLAFHFFGALGFVVGPLIAILLKSVMRSGLLPSFDNPPRR